MTLAKHQQWDATCRAYRRAILGAMERRDQDKARELQDALRRIERGETLCPTASD